MQFRRPASIDVVICIHNALAAVRDCLASVLAARENERIILIDDGSGPETAAYLREVAGCNRDVTLLRAEKATGYTRAVNRGIAASAADLVILLNSDTIVPSGWSGRLADALTRTPGAGLVGPLSNAASFQSIPRIEGSGGQTAINELPPGVSAEDMDLFCQRRSGPVLPRVPLLHGFCLGIGRAVIEAIGGMDEAAFPEGYGEEDDYCVRATDAGFSLVVATNVYVFHSKSQSYGSAKRALLAAAGSRVLNERHGERRIARAVETLISNPILAAMRRRTRRFYRRPVLRWLARQFDRRRRKSAIGR